MKNKNILCIISITLILSGCGNNVNQEISAEELLDMFVDGEIAANYVADEYDPFYITDLPIDVEDFYSYSIGDRVDLDNDGENELIIEGPYGGEYLDARDGQVVDEFALNKEFWETPDTPDGPKTVYTYRDEEITKEEYDALKEKMLSD